MERQFFKILAEHMVLVVRVTSNFRVVQEDLFRNPEIPNGWNEVGPLMFRLMESNALKRVIALREMLDFISKYIEAIDNFTQFDETWFMNVDGSCSLIVVTI